MKKYIVFIIVLVYCTTSLSAQTDEVFSIFSHRHSLNNPATMGLDGYHHLNLGVYKKWFGFEDSPQTFFIASSSPLLNRSLGIGGTLMVDKAAAINTTRFNLNASVHLNPQSDRIFSIGASAAYLNTSFGMANVEDPLLAGDLNASGINLGVGLNYHQKMKGDSFLNLSLALPQFPRTFDLSENGNAESSYKLVNELVIRGNLKYPLSEGVYFTPSIRYYIQLADGRAPKSQVIDLGGGLSFLDDAFNVRLGVRTARASMVYGGIGYRFNQKHNAFVYFEPIGELGSSAAFDADFVLGEVQKTSEREPKEKKSKEPKKPKQKKPRNNLPCYKDTTCIATKIRPINSDNDFDVKIDKSSNFDYVQIGFAESLNNVFDYFEDDDFIKNIALDKLLGYIKEINQEIESKGQNVGQVTFRATIDTPLNKNTYEIYEGEKLFVNYWEEGKTQTEITDGYEMNEAELAAVKLHYLKQEFEKVVLDGDSASTRIEVVHKPGADDYRYIEIILVIR